MLSRLAEQTFIGGRRVTRQQLPDLPEHAATTVHRVKVNLNGSKPPIWRRLEIPSAMPLNLVHVVLQINRRARPGGLDGTGQTRVQRIQVRVESPADLRQPPLLLRT